MEQIWHIFKKDLRRLWPQVLATLILLAWFAFMDGRRSDAVLPAAEGWLNLLLPFTWIYLLGLFIVEDPLVGDRQFWVTTPCSWRSLFGAKALFALAFVHIPFFVAARPSCGRAASRCSRTCRIYSGSSFSCFSC